MAPYEAPKTPTAPRALVALSLVALSALACNAVTDDAPAGPRDAIVTGAHVLVVSSSVSDNPLTAGHVQTATTTLRADEPVSGLVVETRIQDAQGQVVATKTFDAVALAAGEAAHLPFEYASPGTLPAGDYHVAVVVRDPSGKTYLDETTASFAVVPGDGSSTPPAPAGGSGGASSSTNLPARIVGGYFTTWDARNGISLRSVVDTTSYNLIYVAFAVGVSAASGTLHLEVPPGASSAADFKSQIAYANSKGKKVIVSVGGYNDLGSSSGYHLDSPKKVEELMASMRDFRSTWGFDGMDWDLEHGDRPDSAGIVDASRRMKTEFGSSWIIAAAPGVNLPSWVGSGGILDTLGPSGWDLVGEQVYYWGVPDSTYASMIVDRMTALTNKYGASKVVLGNMYKTDVGGDSSLADPQNNFVDIATTKAAFATLRAKGMNPRGAFVWTLQSDADAGYAWQGPNGVGGDILSHP